ncbi:hypothetical protein [Ideonella sp. YS5]|uniref:hypothetical protein n=1 Tax=Ideonella sp. YS5 TaxID=3453714 RepID=UPI003EEB45F6
MSQSPRSHAPGASDATSIRQATVSSSVRVCSMPQRDSAPANTTDLVEVRKRKQRERTRVYKAVDWYMDEAERVYLSVPMIYIYVAGSVTAAAALYQIERFSERQFLERGDPWVRMDQQSWLDCSKLHEQEWLDAREDLRELDLIEERRRYNLERDQIITEIQFLPDGFAKAKTDVRDELREIVRQAIARGESVPGDN